MKKMNIMKRTIHNTDTLYIKVISITNLFEACIILNKFPQVFYNNQTWF
jgi:hypothetical protein